MGCIRYLPEWPRFLGWQHPSPIANMRAAPINPLLLLILVQAWARVKREAAGQTSSISPDAAAIPGWPEGVPLPVGLKNWLLPLLREESLVIEDASWQRTLQSPIFSSACDQWLAPSSLVKLWGQPSAPVLVSMDEVRECHPEGLRAVGVVWMPEWELGLPGELLSLIARAHQCGVSVWFHVKFTGQKLALSENILRQSTQVGWSWWCPPPERSEDLPDWFNAFRPAWGFWLCVSTSEQWAWPWMDIVQRALVERLSGKPPTRTWVKDSRQKSAFLRIEKEVWSRACDVLGSQEQVDMLLAQALLRLVREFPSAH